MGIRCWQDLLQTPRLGCGLAGFEELEVREGGSSQLHVDTGRKGLPPGDTGRVTATPQGGGPFPS